MRFRLLSSTLALTACAVVLLAVTASAATPRELADEYCFHTNAAWCIDKDGDGTRESAPQLHPRFTEEGIEHLREKGRYFDPYDVYEPDPTPTPTPVPTPVPTAAPTAPGAGGGNYSALQSAVLTEDKGQRTRGKATITLASSWSAAWHYRADTGPHANSCTAVDAGTHTVNLTGLGAGTRFIYTAYSDSNCATVLGSVVFTTAVTARNTTLGQNQTGIFVAGNKQVANSFTTGAHSAGYDLKQIIGKFNEHVGDPDPIRVAIHAASGNAPEGNHRWVLTKVEGDPKNAPIGGRIFHFRCPSAACALQSGTTYFVVASVPNSSKNADDRYEWQYTLQDGEQLNPANNGWSLGDVALEKANGGTWADNASGWATRFEVVAFPQ